MGHWVGLPIFFVCSLRQVWTSSAHSTGTHGPRWVNATGSLVIVFFKVESQLHQGHAIQFANCKSLTLVAFAFHVYLCITATCDCFSALSPAARERSIGLSAAQGTMTSPSTVLTAHTLCAPAVFSRAWLSLAVTGAQATGVMWVCHATVKFGIYVKIKHWNWCLGSQGISGSTFRKVSFRDHSVSYNCLGQVAWKCH